LNSSASSRWRYFSQWSFLRVQCWAVLLDVGEAVFVALAGGGERVFRFLGGTVFLRLLALGLRFFGRARHGDSRLIRQSARPTAASFAP